MPLNKLAYSMAKRDSAFTNRGIKKNDASDAQVPQRDARVAALLDARYLGSGLRARRFDSFRAYHLLKALFSPTKSLSNPLELFLCLFSIA